jgi:hypothetical protein
VGLVPGFLETKMISPIITPSTISAQTYSTNHPPKPDAPLHCPHELRAQITIPIPITHPIAGNLCPFTGSLSGIKNPIKIKNTKNIERPIPNLGKITAKNSDTKSNCKESNAIETAIIAMIGLFSVYLLSASLLANNFVLSRIAKTTAKINKNGNT